MNDKEKNKEQLMDELTQARKEIGEIANRLNNVLTGVLGNIDLAKMYLENREPRRKALENLSHADALFPELIELIQSLFELSGRGPQNS